MGKSLTVKQIIEKINSILSENAAKPIIENKGYNAGYDTENGRKFYDIIDMKQLFQELAKGLDLIDSRGTYLFTSDDGYEYSELATFAVKTKKQKQDAYYTWDHKPYWNIVSIKLISKNVENMTIEEVVTLINNKKNEKDNQETEKRRKIYKEVKAELDKFGISREELNTLKKKIDSVGYMWDKFEKE